jgi:lipopolysaccharide biosynthesis glycosyltransferase
MKTTPASCPLVFACDGAYAMPLATTLRSIVEANANSWPLEFHVIADGISKDLRTKVFNSLPTGSATIRWATPDLDLFREFSTCDWISKITFARLLIPRIFPDTTSRVLYLDSDLLVMRALGPLWETDLGGAVVGAVSDAWLDLASKPDGPKCEGLPRVHDYFNAGVLLMDLDLWRKKQVSERALEYLRQHPRSPYSDQDALNVACDQLWKKVDPQWNFQAHLKPAPNMPADQKPGIIHFATMSKPWKASARNPYAKLYDAFRGRTLFARTPGDKLQDMFSCSWAGFKNVCKRTTLIRTLRKQIGPKSPQVKKLSAPQPMEAGHELK